MSSGIALLGWMFSSDECSSIPRCLLHGSVATGMTFDIPGFLPKSSCMLLISADSFCDWFQLSGKSARGTPGKKKDVTFVAPDGEEIKTKRQLDKYLKAHPGTLTASDFEWGGPGRLNYSLRYYLTCFMVKNWTMVSAIPEESTSCGL